MPICIAFRLVALLMCPTLGAQDRSLEKPLPPAPFAAYERANWRLAQSMLEDNKLVVLVDPALRTRDPARLRGALLVAAPSELELSLARSDEELSKALAAISPAQSDELLMAIDLQGLIDVAPSVVGRRTREQLFASDPAAWSRELGAIDARALKAAVADADPGSLGSILRLDEADGLQATPSVLPMSADAENRLKSAVRTANPGTLRRLLEPLDRDALLAALQPSGLEALGSTERDGQSSRRVLQAAAPSALRRTLLSMDRERLHAILGNPDMALTDAEWKRLAEENATSNNWSRVYEILLDRAGQLLEAFFPRPTVDTSQTLEMLRRAPTINAPRLVCSVDATMWVNAPSSGSRELRMRLSLRIARLFLVDGQITFCDLLFADAADASAQLAPATAPATELAAGIERALDDLTVTTLRAIAPSLFGSRRLTVQTANAAPRNWSSSSPQLWLGASIASQWLQEAEGKKP